MGFGFEKSRLAVSKTCLQQQLPFIFISHHTRDTTLKHSLSPLTVPFFFHFNWQLRVFCLYTIDTTQHALSPRCQFHLLCRILHSALSSIPPPSNGVIRLDDKIRFLLRYNTLLLSKSHSIISRKTVDEVVRPVSESCIQLSAYRLRQKLVSCNTVDGHARAENLLSSTNSDHILIPTSGAGGPH